MEDVKQVIVVIKEYADRYRGKMMAQVAHASIGSLLSKFNKSQDENGNTKYSVEFEKDSVLDKWLNGIFTKVVLYVESEKELLELLGELDNFNKDRDINDSIPFSLITDSGLTVFHGTPTITCLGIGPWYSEDINKITGKLKLLK